MKKTKQDREDDQVLREIKQAIDCSEFDGEGFRVHKPDLLAPGQMFSPWLPEKGMGKQELSEVLALEYARECRWAYDYQIDFWSCDSKPPTPAAVAEFQKKWPAFMVEIVDYIFPLRPLEGLRQNEILARLAPRPAANVYPLRDASHIFSEPGQPALAAFARDLYRDYWLHIDWSKGT